MEHPIDEGGIGGRDGRWQMVDGRLGEVLEEKVFLLVFLSRGILDAGNVRNSRY